MTPGSLLPSIAGPLTSHGNDAGGLALLGVGFLVGLVFMYAGAKKFRLGQRIRNTPTERVRSVAAGRTEVTGTCRDVGTTYEQPYADGECVYRKWQVEEYRRKTGPDESGSEWVVADSGTDVAPFFVEDETERILVDTTDSPAFDISSENSYRATVDRGEDPPPEVASFSPASTGLLETVAGDVKPGEAMSNVPGMGAAEGMFGDMTVSEMMNADSRPEEMPSQEDAQRQFMQQYFDEDVLNEDGQLREDVTEAELQAAMTEDMQGTTPTELFGEMIENAGTSGVDGDGRPEEQSGTDDREGTGGDGDARQGPPEVVQELGGTGSARTLGTGSSLGAAIVDAILHRVSGGRFGSPMGGVFGRGSADGRYTKRRYTHEVLPVDDDVYVFGGASPRADATGVDVERLKLGTDDLTGQFIVADRDESDLIKHFSRRGPLYVGIGLLVSAGSLAGLLVALGIA